MNGFEDIQDLLSDILDDSKPLPSVNLTASAHKAGKARTPMPKEAVAAVTEIAVETFDPELLEIAATEQALSSEQAERARRKVIEHAATKFEDAMANRGLLDSIADVIGEVNEVVDAANAIAADLPDELVPTADDAFRDPEGAADTVAPRPQARAVKTNPRLAESLRKVTQGVTGASPAMRHVTETLRDKIDAGTVTTDDVEAALANVKGAIFADTLDRKREEEVESLRIPMPEFTSDDLMETMDLRNYATLVTLNTARWHAKVKDRKASRDAAHANDAVEDAFETQKKLLVGVDGKLKAIHKAIDSARAKHYELTLPWTTKGVNDMGRRTGARLLVNTLFFEYTKAMAECKAEMKNALESFVPDYPDLIEQARKKLGKSFNPAEYPNVESIRSHFDLSFDFQPIPKGDDFQGLPKQQLDRLADTINRKSQQMMENAMQDVWTRLYEAVTHMHDRLSSPDKTFHYTMTDNVREVTRLLKHLNITGNTDIENIRKYLDKFICPHDAKELRENNVLRQQVAAHVQNVIDKMRKVGGVA